MTKKLRERRVKFRTAKPVFDGNADAFSGSMEARLKSRLSARMILSGLAATIFLTAGLVAAPPVLAQPAKGASGLPLPRFVSLKARRVNLRIGPSRDYAVNWLYTRSGIPMEIIQEYDHWRRVRDLDGTEGWIHKSLLTGDAHRRHCALEARDQRRLRDDARQTSEEQPAGRQARTRRDPSHRRVQWQVVPG